MKPLLFINFCLAIALALPAPCAADTLLVRQDGSGTHTSLPAALEAASPGDTVEVGPGTWPLHAVLEKGLTLRAEEGPGSAILDGLGTDRILQLETPYGAADSTIYRLEDLVFRRGSKTIATAVGGAVFCRGGARFEISGCRFEENSGWDGGALHARLGARVRVEDSSFDSNNAVRVGGAATFILGAQVEFTRCTFRENEAFDFAGAVATNDCSVDFDQCRFFGNDGGAGTGALNLLGTVATVVNSSFLSNRSGARATVVAEHGTELHLGNNILAYDGGAAAVVVTSSSVADRHCNLYWANEGGPSAEGAEVTGIVSDPLFCDLTGENWVVAENSPALLPTQSCPAGRGGVEAGCEAAELPAALAAEQGFVHGAGGHPEPVLRLGLRGGPGQGLTVAAFQLELGWDVDEYDVPGFEVVAPGDWVEAAELVGGRLKLALASLEGVGVGEGFTPLVELSLEQYAIPAAGSALQLLRSEFLDPAGEAIDHARSPILVMPSCNPGDADGDGDADLADALHALGLVADDSGATDAALCSADVVAPAGLRIGDVVAILRMALGLGGEPARRYAAMAHVSLEAPGGTPSIRVEGAAGVDLELEFWPDRPEGISLEVPDGLARVLPVGQHRLRVLWARGGVEAADATIVLPGPWEGGEMRIVGHEAVDLDGAGLDAEVDDGPLQVGDGPLRPVDLQLAVQPNPFNPRTRLELVLPHAMPGVTVELYDASGRRVRHWELFELTAGPLGIDWDGRDGLGREVGSGVYFVRARGAGMVAKARAVLVR